MHKGYFDLRKARDLPTHVTGARMVLFLREAKDGAAEEGGKARRWQSANLLDSDQMGYSVMWIENGEAFAFAQWMNPGPNDLSSYQRLSDVDLKKRVEKLVEAQGIISKAMAMKDPAERAKALFAIIRTEYDWVEYKALEHLRTCGKEAVPCLCQLLSDEKRTSLYYWIGEEFWYMPAEDAGPALTGLLREELAFWQKAGPTLKPGWGVLTGTGDDKDKLRLLCHSQRLSCVLQCLCRLDYPKCQSTVRELRRVLQALPAAVPKEMLVDSKRDPMQEWCAKILGEQN